MNADSIRMPSVAGLFYPGDPTELRRDLDRLFAEANPAVPNRHIKGIVAPHAGYMYSGSTAAAGYALLSGATYDVVVVASPSHKEFFDGISVYPGAAYQTPLGVIPIAEELRNRLLHECPLVRATEIGHQKEHAIEVHLPFLQWVLPAFKLLPLVIGHQSKEICFGLGRALGKILREENVLLVASTDLSHYYPSAVADRLDAVVVGDLQQFDEQGLMDDLDSGKAEACGGGPMVAVMTALKSLGAKTIEVVHHCNSGDITGDRSSVVGYLTAVVYADEPHPS